MLKTLVSTNGLSREDWLKYRRMGIDGSDASVICGVNMYQSPIELRLNKTGQQVDDEAGEAAYWGHQLEPLVRAEFAKRSGIDVVEIAAILQSEDYPHMLANVDGLCKCPTHGRCVFEAKTANQWKADEWDGDSIPQEYYLQVMHYLAVTGYEGGCYIAVLIGGNDFRWKHIPRDEATISKLIRLESAFWQHVEWGVPPMVDGSEASTSWLNKQFPQSVPSSRIVLPEDCVELIRQYAEARDLEEHYANQKRKAENELKILLSQNEVGVIGEVLGLVRWSNVTSNEFDSKAFQSEQPELYEQYLRESSYRRFTIKAA